LTRPSIIPNSPTLAYTLGEPGGIGADIIIQLVQQEALPEVVCIGDKELLTARAQQLDLPLTLLNYPETATQRASLSVLHLPLQNIDTCGQVKVANATSVLEILNMAIDGCVSGRFDAMVTGPLHKGVINDAGISFSGHTEYLAERTGAQLPVMMLASPLMRVALMTTHLPLKKVSEAITNKLIHKVCSIVHHDLQTKFGFAQPKIAVCGLNPHAGEGGHLGSEETEIIIPALDELRTKGLDLIGPLPADTLFTAKHLEQFDIAIAMYHDQGLPVIKSHGFGDIANITLGLPIIRTSVDHGTALDLAGSGKADTGSLVTAINVAKQMTKSSLV